MREPPSAPGWWTLNSPGPVGHDHPGAVTRACGTYRCTCASTQLLDHHDILLTHLHDITIVKPVSARKQLQTQRQINAVRGGTLGANQ